MYHAVQKNSVDVKSGRLHCLSKSLRFSTVLTNISRFL